MTEGYKKYVYLIQNIPFYNQKLIIGEIEKRKFVDEQSLGNKIPGMEEFVTEKQNFTDSPFYKEFLNSQIFREFLTEKQNFAIIRENLEKKLYWIPEKVLLLPNLTNIWNP